MKPMAKPPIKAKKSAGSGSSSAHPARTVKPAGKADGKPANGVKSHPPAAKPAKAPKAGTPSTKPAAAAKANASGKAKPVAKAVIKAPEVSTSKAAPAKDTAARKPRTDLNGKIVHMMAEEMALEEAELTPAASLKEDLNLDAIDIAELLMQAESQFSLTPFSEEDWEGCETVEDFVTLVEKRVSARRGKKPVKSGKATR